MKKPTNICFLKAYVSVSHNERCQQYKKHLRRIQLVATDYSRFQGHEKFKTNSTMKGTTAYLILFESADWCKLQLSVAWAYKGVMSVFEPQATFADAFPLNDHCVRYHTLLTFDVLRVCWWTCNCKHVDEMFRRKKTREEIGGGCRVLYLLSRRSKIKLYGELT